MRAWQNLVSRIRLAAPWRSMARHGHNERDLDDEIRFDVSEETQLLIERGESVDSARAAARRNCGSITRVREETREAWGWAAPERLARDLGFAIRTLRKSPSFSLTSVLTLAVGIGLCSFIFNTLDALFLRPLPGVRAPERLVSLEYSSTLGAEKPSARDSLPRWACRYCAAPSFRTATFAPTLRPYDACAP